MLDEALNIILEGRINEALKVCEELNKEILEKFNFALEKIKITYPGATNDLHVLEDIFIQKHTNIIKEAYRLGYSDSKQIRREAEMLFR